MAKRTLHKRTTRFISVMLSVLLVVNTLGLSAFAAEGTASAKQPAATSVLPDQAQDQAQHRQQQQ